jgi:hypothetical protein
MPYYTEDYEAHGMPISVTKYEPEDWELAGVQEYEKREQEMQNNLAMALNNSLAAKFQIENLNNPKIPYQTRIEVVNRCLDSIIKSIQEVQQLADI